MFQKEKVLFLDIKSLFLNIIQLTYRKTMKGNLCFNPP